MSGTSKDDDTLQVKIGPVIYSVVVTSDPIPLGDSGDLPWEIAWGKFYAVDGVIMIKKGHFDSMREAAIHEVLHAIYYISGMAHFKRPTEEQLVSLLSPYFTSFLTDNFNSKFLAYFGIGKSEKSN